MARRFSTGPGQGFLFTDDQIFLADHHYTVNITLGGGSYAKVKRAFSEKLQHQVAVKIVDLRKAEKAIKEKFFRRELEISRYIKHPNCIRVYEILERKAYKFYIVMELAGHGDLLEYIKLRGALTEGTARTMFNQLCQAMAYLHENHIVHRDLKCENLLLDVNNNIKVTDFGFARYFQNAQDMSWTFCGSLAYAAPEILKGVSYYIPQHDVWAMGVILYIMVCGEMPFDDTNIQTMLQTQVKRELRFSRIRLVPEQVKDLISHILVADFRCRYSLHHILRHCWLWPGGSVPGPSSLLEHRSSKTAVRGFQPDPVTMKWKGEHH